MHRIDNAGDLFLFRDKKWNVQIFSEMYKRPKKMHKIWMSANSYCDFCEKKCAYFAIFETQLRDGEFDHQKD